MAKRPRSEVPPDGGKNDTPLSASSKASQGEREGELVQEKKDLMIVSQRDLSNAIHEAVKKELVEFGKGMAGVLVERLHNGLGDELTDKLAGRIAEKLPKPSPSASRWQLLWVILAMSFLGGVAMMMVYNFQKKNQVAINTQFAGIQEALKGSPMKDIEAKMKRMAKDAAAAEAKSVIFALRKMNVTEISSGGDNITQLAAGKVIYVYNTCGYEFIVAMEGGTTAWKVGPGEIQPLQYGGYNNVRLKVTFPNGTRSDVREDFTGKAWLWKVGPKGATKTHDLSLIRR